MKSDVIRLRQSLETGEFLSAAIIDPVAVPTALDSRDSSPFDENWMRVTSDLRRVGKADVENEVFLIQIRELAFKSAYRFSEDADFAGYVSDDFDLIGRALLFDYQSSWLSGLFQTYITGHFPHGEISPVEKDLKHLF